VKNSVNIYVRAWCQLDDQKILELFFERNETALAEVKNKYGGRFFKTALNILQSREDAEECVNDALFKSWEAIPPMYPDRLGAYIVKIVRNLALHKWEAKRAAKRGGGEVSVLMSELEGEMEECIPAGKATEPEEKYEAGLITQALNTWLSTLDKNTKAVFVLRYFHGESIRDISEKFKISESKVKSVLFRARKKLNAFLVSEDVL